MPKPTFTKPGPSKPAVEEEVSLVVAKFHLFVQALESLTFSIFLQSSEYETDSDEEEEPLKPIYKPVFVSKYVLSLPPPPSPNPFNPTNSRSSHHTDAIEILSPKERKS